VVFRYGVANALPADCEHRAITADLLFIPALRRGAAQRGAVAWELH